MIEGKLFIAL